MRLTPSDTVDHIDLNRSIQRSSSSHEERILRRNLPPASFCENFVLAVFSTFSTESATSSHSERRSDPRNVSPGSLVSLLGVSSVADAHETGEHQSCVASAC